MSAITAMTAITAITAILGVPPVSTRFVENKLLPRNRPLRHAGFSGVPPSVETVAKVPGCHSLYFARRTGF
jgi:hypothetical protein